MAADRAVTWEYGSLSTATMNLVSLVEGLNNLAADGWELVTFDDVDKTVGINSLVAIVRRPIEPLPPPQPTSEGWYPDPAGRFARRYWNGRAWTFHVCHEGDKKALRDPPTALTPAPDLTQ
jgi:hypothetical protein